MFVGKTSQAGSLRRVRVPNRIIIDLDGQKWSVRIVRSHIWEQLACYKELLLQGFPFPVSSCGCFSRVFV